MQTLSLNATVLKTEKIQTSFPIMAALCKAVLPASVLILTSAPAYTTKNIYNMSALHSY
jgi:hypothetical protein